MLNVDSYNDHEMIEMDDSDDSDDNDDMHTVVEIRNAMMTSVMMVRMMDLTLFECDS